MATTDGTINNDMAKELLDTLSTIILHHCEEAKSFFNKDNAKLPKGINLEYIRII